MLTFKVVSQPHGWAIQMDGRMTTPFWSKDVAIREANCLADAIRCHGQPTEVVIQSSALAEHHKLDLVDETSSFAPATEVLLG
jgi:hypothetical protein